MPKNRLDGFRRTLAGAVLTLVAAAAPPAVADPPQLAEEFDLDESGWTAADADSDVGWSTLDADACTPASGSAVAIHGAATAGSGRNFVPPDCVTPITALATYSFGARLNFPPGQLRTGSAQMVVVWVDAPDCSGLVVGSAGSPNVTTATAGSWTPTANAAAVAPAGTLSASVRVRVEKNEAGGQLAMHFDRVYLARGSLVFQDAFETGSTCRWSSSVD